MLQDDVWTTKIILGVLLFSELVGMYVYNVQIVNFDTVFWLSLHIFFKVLIKVSILFNSTF